MTRLKWFIVCQTKWCEANGEKNFTDPQVLKGVSKETVVKRFIKSDLKRTRHNDYGGSYAPVFDHEAIAQFDSELEAISAMLNWKDFVPKGSGW